MTGTSRLLLCDLSLAVPFAGWRSGYGDSWPIRSFPSDAFVQYYTVAMQILCYYDYILTLPDEVPFIPYHFCDSFTVA